MLHVFGRVGYRIDTAILPMIAYAGFVHIETGDGAFTEDGGITAVSGASANNQITYSMLGVRSALAPTDLYGMAFTPRFDVAWIIPFIALCRGSF